MPAPSASSRSSPLIGPIGRERALRRATVVSSRSTSNPHWQRASGATASPPCLAPSPRRRPSLVRSAGRSAAGSPSFVPATRSTAERRLDRHVGQELSTFIAAPVIQVGPKCPNVRLCRAKRIPASSAARSRRSPSISGSEGLGPGDLLPSEAAMTRQLNVSRTIVREAFRSLSAMRLIDMCAGRRATVAKLDTSRDVDGHRAWHHHPADQRSAGL